MLNLTKGDSVILYGFTGIQLGVFKVHSTTKKTITILKKNGDELIFDRKTGKQVNVEEGKERYANTIIEDDGSYVPPNQRKAAKGEKLEGYAAWNKKDLKKEARGRGIRVPKGTSKEELINALEAFDAGEKPVLGKGHSEKATPAPTKKKSKKPAPIVDEDDEDDDFEEEDEEEEPAPKKSSKKTPAKKAKKSQPADEDEDEEDDTDDEDEEPTPAPKKKSASKKPEKKSKKPAPVEDEDDDEDDEDDDDDFEEVDD